MIDSNLLGIVVCLEVDISKTNRKGIWNSTGKEYPSSDDPILIDFGSVDELEVISVSMRFSVLGFINETVAISAFSPGSRPAEAVHQYQSEFSSKRLQFLVLGNARVDL